jgi:hypothetical protein
MTTQSFETFKLNTRGNIEEYAYLLNMPLGAHQHFKADDAIEKKIRSAVSRINKSEFTTGDGAHFSVHRVSSIDPKGAGIRVLRDDKPIRTRTRRNKTAVQEAAE